MVDEAMMTASPDGRKPRKLDKQMFDLLTKILSYHNTFPSHFRERVFNILNDHYSPWFTPEQKTRMEVSMTQNLDDKRLPEKELYRIQQQEFPRLRDSSANHCKEPSYLSLPSL